MFYYKLLFLACAWLITSAAVAADSELSNRKTPIETTSEFCSASFAAKYFFRNDDNAKLPLRLYSKTECKVKFVWETEGLPAQTQTLKLKEGWNDCSAKFQPALFLPGKRDLCFTFYDQNGKKLFEKTYPVEIKKQLRRDLVKFFSWGGFGDVPLDYLAELGINAVNTSSMRKLDDISDKGMFINYDLRNTKELEANNFDIKKTVALKLPELHILKNYFNWYATLLNSEAFNKWRPLCRRHARHN
jgi:hypothetical protein